jgi:DNA-binding NarL/FixJ family response regulator
MHAPGEYAFRAIKSGAAGYLTKDSAAEELILAVQTILKGKRYITSEVAELIAESCTTTSSIDPLETLTDKEFEIFKLLVSGKKAAAIANNLSIRQSSIAYYRGNILQKMHVQSNSELIRFAIQHNLA